MAKPAIKLKKCVVCKNEFQLFRSLQKCCSHQCALKLAVSVREKDERKAHRKAKESLKTRSDHLRAAQTAFNRYIRVRDHGKACISCGRTDAVKWDAGHYKSVGAYPELRFEERNCYRQCGRPCNADLSGNIHEYRKGLIERFGAEEVEWLEGPHEPRNYTIEEIKAIKKKYNTLARVLEKALE